MAKVFYLTPYMKGNIGGGINESIALLPKDAWVCIRDADTLFLTPKVQQQIQEIVDANTEYSLIGCRTNRLRSQHVTYKRDELFNCADMDKHVAAAYELESTRWGEVSELPIDEIVAGMFMLFPVSLWDEIKIPEYSIRFDIEYGVEARLKGHKLGMAEGIYLFHLYRWGAENPFTHIEHLL